MTAQIPDEVRYQDDEYTLVGVNGDNLSTPEDFGIITHSRTTACWRGYVMKFECIDGQLMLQEMMVNAQTPPKIKGVAPKTTHKKDTQFEFIYENLRLKKQLELHDREIQKLEKVIAGYEKEEQKRADTEADTGNLALKLLKDVAAASKEIEKLSAENLQLKTRIAELESELAQSGDQPDLL